MSEPKPFVGISSCLMGEMVRYDGGHKASSTCLGPLNRALRWVGMCPEVGAGFGTPRPPIYLVREQDSVLALNSESMKTCQEAIIHYARTQHEKLANLSGFVLRTRSPSCGKASVVITNSFLEAKDFALNQNASPDANTNKGALGNGVFCQYLLEHFPHLPLIEDVELRDTQACYHFLVRVLAYQNLKSLPTKPAIMHLQRFHAEHKYLLLAHDEASYRVMGKLVAESKSETVSHTLVQYQELLTKALSKRAEKGGHLNTLYHMQGYFKQVPDKNIRSCVGKAIEAYGLGKCELGSVLELVFCASEQAGIAYLLGQKYLHYYRYAAKYFEH